MKIYAPNYYNAFKCIADKCNHSCCVGWEIDIDNKTLDYYKNVEGDFGNKLRKNISFDENPHFKLCQNERCPFLNSNNLCEIILNLGEEHLSQICTDHPRYRNFFEDRLEIGLGLCCEEAVRILLSEKNKTTVVLICENDLKEEQNSELSNLILKTRQRAFEILQNRKIPLKNRINNLIDEFNLKIPNKSNCEWYKVFYNLERLSNEWTVKLSHLKSNKSFAENSDFEIPFEQLIIYFLYRYLPQATDDTEIKAYMCFAILSFNIIKTIFYLENANNNSLKPLSEIVRLYSSEIEYSEENINTLIDILWEENYF